MTAFDDTNLRVLHLQNNFLEFKNLEESSLEFDRASPFQNLHQLQVLNVRNNSMRSFLNDWHTVNVALIDLDLSHNQIEIINFGNIFNIWKDEIKINVSNNKISAVRAPHRFVFNELQPQTVWILNHNPLKCDCSVMHFAIMLRNQTNSKLNSHTKVITDQLECASPEHFVKRRLEHIPLAELTCPLDAVNANDKKCPDRCTCFVRTYDRTAVFNCSNANLNEIPKLPDIKRLGLQFYELHIENNNITTLSMGNSTGYKNVNRIYAKNNSMVNILPENLPHDLFTLDLSANMLKIINPGVLHKLTYMQNLQTISFGRNPLICDCGAYELKAFIETHINKFMGINETICDNEKFLILINASGLCPIAKTIIWIISIVLIVILVALSSTFIYKYQQEIKVWMFLRGFTWVFSYKSDDQKTFDAFILHSSLDEQFVQENLVKNLENDSKSFKVCSLMQDIKAGDIVPNKVILKKIIKIIFFR